MNRLAGMLIWASIGVMAVHAQQTEPAKAQLSPQAQMTVDRQLAAPQLDPSVMVSNFGLANATLRDTITVIAKAGTITVRYHSAVTDLTAPASLKEDKATIESALQSVLGPKTLAFKVDGRRSIFIYPDTAENRQKYTDSIRSFEVTKADVGALGTTINRSLSSIPADELRPTVVSISSPRVIFVRATPGMMARIAQVIADNDK